MKKFIVFIFTLIVGVFWVFRGGLIASSPDAWEEFRTNVTRACTKLAPPELKNSTIVVDDYGSESYGIAILRGIQEKAAVTYVCIYDKKLEKAELSGQIDLKTAKKIKK
jgi:hypothetical protein